MKFLERLAGPRSLVAAQEAQDRAERLLADSFRLLSQLCGKMADLVEAQRLGRAGYSEPGRFLERLDEKEPRNRH